jgi:hypothetical protein
MSLFSSSGMSLSSLFSSSSSSQGKRLSQPLREILNHGLVVQHSSQLNLPPFALPFGLEGERGGGGVGGRDNPGNSTETGLLESIWEGGEGGEGGGGGTRGGGAGEGRERRICVVLLGAGWEVVVLQVSVVK